MSRLLSELGHEAIVAHARDVRLESELLKYSDYFFRISAAAGITYHADNATDKSVDCPDAQDAYSRPRGGYQ